MPAYILCRYRTVTEYCVLGVLFLAEVVVVVCVSIHCEMYRDKLSFASSLIWSKLLTATSAVTISNFSLGQQTSGSTAYTKK